MEFIWLTILESNIEIIVIERIHKFFKIINAYLVMNWINLPGLMVFNVRNRYVRLQQKEVIFYFNFFVLLSLNLLNFPRQLSKFSWNQRNSASFKDIVVGRTTVCINCASPLPVVNRTLC